MLPEEDDTRTRTRDDQDQEEPQIRTALSLPIKGESFEGDERYREIPIALPPQIGGIPKGWPIVVVSDTTEEAQRMLGFPCGGMPIVAVNDADADPELATTISELDDENEIDPLRQARIHSAYRVVRPAN